MRALAVEWIYTLLILTLKVGAALLGMACLAVLYVEALGWY